MQKLVKTQETFNSLLAITDNETRILETVKISIISRIENDKNYSKNSMKYLLVPKSNLLDGFVLERVN
jgi:hypothetical protein